MEQGRARETPFFFSNGPYRLFGVLHEAEGEPNGEGFVFCSPFGEEKLWTHRVFVTFARELSKAGYSVLRFDYMGNGDSEGDFSDSSVETMLADIRCAARTLQTRTGCTKAPGLLGLRFGATLCALAGAGEPGFETIILWEPILNGAAYMRELLRVNLSTQASVYKEIRHNSEALIKWMKEGRTVNIDGYEMSLPLYEQSAAIDLVNLQGGPLSSGRVLVVPISRKEGEVSSPIRTFQNRTGNCDVMMAREEPFWKEIKPYYPRAGNLFRLTMEWIRT